MLLWLKCYLKWDNGDKKTKALWGATLEKDNQRGKAAWGMASVLTSVCLQNKDETFYEKFTYKFLKCKMKLLVLDASFTLAC